MTLLDELRAADLAAIRRLAPRAELEAFVHFGGRLEGLLSLAYPDLAERATALKSPAVVFYEREIERAEQLCALACAYSPGVEAAMEKEELMAKVVIPWRS